MTSFEYSPIIPEVKRRIDLSRVLEPGWPMSSVAVCPTEKRIHNRFDKAVVVVIGSELYGDAVAVARNISAGGLLVEMSYAPPLGSVVTVHFRYEHEAGVVDEIVARAEVKHHHYLNFANADDQASTRAIGLRFIEFLDPGERVERDRIH